MVHSSGELDARASLEAGRRHQGVEALEQIDRPAYSGGQGPERPQRRSRLTATEVACTASVLVANKKRMRKEPPKLPVCLAAATAAA